MTEPAAPMTGAPAVRLLHLALTTGLAASLGVFLLLFQLGHAPLLPPDARPEWLGVVLGCAGVAPVALGFAIFRARVPKSAGQQSADEYWRVRENISAALLFWVLLEGGGATAAVGMVMTGGLLPGIVAALALAALVLNGQGGSQRQKLSDPSTSRCTGATIARASPTPANRLPPEGVCPCGVTRS